MSSNFNVQMDWAKKRGLFLNQSIERKSVNGVYGMYATRPIKKGTKLTSFPVDQLLSANEGPFCHQPNEKSLNWIYNASCERAKAETEYSGIFEFFEPIEVLRQYHSYFLTEDELALIKSMSAQLFNWVEQSNLQANRVVDQVAKTLPSLDRDSIVENYLNFRSRGFHPFGVVPVLDQFNHSDLLGQQDKFEDGHLCVYAKGDYQKGEQLFISYGPKDLYHHAIHYSYFDPSGPHFVEFGRKAIQSSEGPLGSKMVSHLRQFFKIQEIKVNGINAFYFDEPLMLLIENAPSHDLVRALKELCRVAIGRPVSDRELTQQAAKYFEIMIDDQLRINNFESVPKSKITPRVQRFYDVLNKEKRMLLGNRAALQALLKAS